jgi:Mn2+/Fe2+ NRAMP family transporter
MAGVQLICARIGLVYGCGLAAIMRKSFPKKLVYLAIISLLIANTINAAADMQAIAAGINMLVPIPIAGAATLHQSGNKEMESATQATEALKPVAGNAAYVLMALVLIGTGVLAVPILTTSAAFDVAEAFGWNVPGQPKEFYLVMAACTVVALAIDYLGVNPMKALFITAVINGFLSAPLLVGIMLVSNDRKIMGEHTNGRVVNILGWTTTALMSVAALVLVWTWFQ